MRAIGPQCSQLVGVPIGIDQGLAPERGNIKAHVRRLGGNVGVV